MTSIENHFEQLRQSVPNSVAQAEKSALMLEGLNHLSAHHYERCEPYRNILKNLWDGNTPAKRLEDVPYLPVSLFKTLDLKSADTDDLKMTLTSSGTTGQAVSQIFVDSETSMRQQKALAHSLGFVLGKKRLPMLVIDTADVFKNPKYMSARGAGVMGMMRYGHSHSYALDGDLNIDIPAIKAFLKEHGDAPFMMFGFTFIVWINFIQALGEEDIDLSNGILIHSGGWKKMEDRKVDNTKFRAELKRRVGLSQIYNFYGMVEQIGSIFLEGNDGRLYPPNFSDVIIRNPVTWEPQPMGEPGIIQVLSLLPKSYPGHSLLTEDRGVIEDIDPGVSASNGKTWMGKGIRILGRIPKAELRGCSDVVATQQAQA